MFLKKIFITKIRFLKHIVSIIILIIETVLIIFQPYYYSFGNAPTIGQQQLVQRSIGKLNF